ncbi:MAG: hypothetical protein ACI8XB_000667 [Patiriisocius sp.]|jgi:hypothetical protein
MSKRLTETKTSNKNVWLSALIVLLLLIFRIFLGIQTNFSHLDYEQIYLMGLENAYSGNWSFWGPDVVWSQTRLAGALQGLLVGIPIKFFNHPYAPIVLSNIISTGGLVILAVYVKKRFENFSLNFILILFLLLPAYLHHGTVLLNTSYLILSGALLFISVFDRFVYQDNMFFKKTHWYFLCIGFALLFTYQLHLTWVMFLPFIVVLLFYAWKEDKKKGSVSLLYLLIGGLISGSLLLPTIWQYGDVIYSGAGGNLTFKPERFAKVFDLILRHFSFASFDIVEKADIYKLSMEQSAAVKILIWTVKILSAIQFLGILYAVYMMKKGKEFKRLMIVYGLSILMALVLFVLGNKHLSARTYILLYPLPIMLSFYAYDYLLQKKFFKPFMTVSLIAVFITFTGIAMTNYKGVYSFDSVKEPMDRAFETKDPYDFAKRRESIMDDYN